MQAREGSLQLCPVFPDASSCTVACCCWTPPLQGPHAPGAQSTEMRDLLPQRVLPTSHLAHSLAGAVPAPLAQRAGCLLERLPWVGKAQSRWLRGCPSAGPGRRAGCWGLGTGDAKRRALSRSPYREPLSGLRDSREGPSPRHWGGRPVWRVAVVRACPGRDPNRPGL